MTRACILLADGFEEIEAITIIDVLRRGRIETMILGVEQLDVVGGHHITVHADALLQDHLHDQWDAVILPGGLEGAEKLRDLELVQIFIKRQHRKGKLIGAICAAPIALAKAHIIDDRRVTSYPGFEKELAHAIRLDEKVVVDDHIITSQGPGTALEFALKLVSELRGSHIANRLNRQLLTAFHD